VEGACAPILSATDYTGVGSMNSEQPRKRPHLTPMIQHLSQIILTPFHSNTFPKAARYCQIPHRYHSNPSIAAEFKFLCLHTTRRLAVRSGEVRTHALDGARGWKHPLACRTTLFELWVAELVTPRHLIPWIEVLAVRPPLHYS